MRNTNIRDFWNKYTVKGKRQGYTAILKCLAAIRAADNDQLAKLARNEYGSEFARTFGYKKGKAWVIKVKSSDIAKQYCAIKGIAREEEEEEEDHC